MIIEVQDLCVNVILKELGKTSHIYVFGTLDSLCFINPSLPISENKATLIQQFIYVLYSISPPNKP